jgi:maleate isomerase
MRRVRLGMLTPSSNTVVEPLCARMTAQLPEVTVHFARFKVTAINLGDQANSQFALPVILDAARLLADAKVDVIAWNGTSAAWLGFDKDRELTAAIERETGARAATSMLAMNEVFQQLGARRVGLVTPYLGDVQARIVETYSGIGIDCSNERHYGDPGNFSFAEVPEAWTRGAVAEVAAAKPDAIAIVCTNLWGAHLVPELEAAHGIPVIDSLAVAVWKSLALAGVDRKRVKGWGQLFDEL